MVFIFSANLAVSQVPVKDRKHQEWSKIMEEVQVASQAINTRVTAFVGNIKDIQQFMSKASMIVNGCLLYTSPSPRDLSTSRMPSSA